jgi:alanine-synthesizing transaminase
MRQLQFSHRTEWEVQENPLTLLLRELRAEGSEILDWTVSNPTLCNFPYDRDAISRGLTRPVAFTYVPDPAGALSARVAVAEFLKTQQVDMAPGRLLLTASSSEAYSYLFRLLCNAGERIAVPKPGYPLCEDLARLNDISLDAYRMHYAGSWHIDEQSLRQALTPLTRAIVVIHPNNPTGSFLSAGEQEMVAEIAREHGVAVIADEVFLTYAFGPQPAAQTCAHMRAPLLFTLNGLSKMAGLPQLKLGWIGVHGDDPLAAQAMQRLEMIADTYLSVNTPVQMALPEILDTAAVLGEHIRARVAGNYAALQRSMKGSEVSVLHADAGWNAILQLPRIRNDEEWTLHLLGQKGLLVFPGHFFDMEAEGCIIISLLPEETAFLRYCTILRAAIKEEAG